MKSRVILDLLCSTETDALQVLQAITGDRGGRAVFAVDRPEVVKLFDNQWRVSGDVRFATAADADAWRDAVVSRWSGGGLRNRILVGSRVGRHDCTHDDPVPTPCVETVTVK